MTIHRRSLIAAAPLVAAWPAWSQMAPPSLAAYERATGGRVGVYACNYATGATLSWRADEQFVMCSTFKASLAALVLSRVDSGAERLDRYVSFGPGDLLPYAPIARPNLGRGSMTVEELCAGAVSWSDNTCANLLLRTVGGPGALTDFWRSTGDQYSRLDHWEPMLNRSPPGDPRDTTTPDAMAATIRRLLLGRVLSVPSRRMLTDWMVDCRTGDDRLRAGLPTVWRVADKTGNNGADAAGDIGMVWPEQGRPVVVCAYVQGGAPRRSQIAAVFADIGRMVGDRLG